MNLSAVVLAKNEEKNIASCLESLSFADEVILIDDNSTDRTIEIARKFGAKVYERALSEDFAAQRNYGLKKAFGKWVLFVDSDEVVSPALGAEIIQITNNPLIGYQGFFLKRYDSLWGKTLRYGETGSIKLLRLAQKNSGQWNRKVHEVWEVSGPTGLLKNPLLHFPHKSLHEFIYDVNRWSDIDVVAKKEEKRASNLVKIVFWPKAKFIRNWILHLGFLDGMPGFVVALIMSFHSFLSWSKLWEEQKHSI